MAQVVVVREDGSLLCEFAYFDGMRGEDIYETLRSDGYKGDLYLQKGRIFPGMPLSPGVTYTFIEEQPKDDAWFQKHDKLPSPSALANSASAMVSAFGTDEPVYDMGRTSGSAVPLPLANESFRRYIKNLQSCVRDAADWSFVYSSMNMSKFFSDERQRQAAFASYLQQYLTSKMPNLTFNVTLSDIRVEALIMGEWVLLLLVEVKPEVGLGGEPSVEVMRCYANHFIAKRSMYHWVYLLSCCPVLIVEVVGPTIRVGGAAFFDRPTHEPFTPYLHIHRFLQDNGHLELLSRALASIGVAVSSLVEFYTTLWQQQQGTDPRIRDPTISWPDMIRYEHVKGAAVTQYSRPKVQAAAASGYFFPCYVLLPNALSSSARDTV